MPKIKREKRRRRCSFGGDVIPDPIRIPGPVIRGQHATRSSGVIRSLKSDRAHAGPYFRRGVTSLAGPMNSSRPLLMWSPQEDEGIRGPPPPYLPVPFLGGPLARIE